MKYILYSMTNRFLEENRDYRTNYEALRKSECERHPVTGMKIVKIGAAVLTNEQIDRKIDIQEVADNPEEALDAINYLKQENKKLGELYKKIKTEVRETSQNLQTFIQSTEYKIAEMERRHEEELQDLRNQIE